MIAIFGGTFDPVHNGHLKIIQLILEKINRGIFNFREIRVLPCGIPPHHKQPIATPEQRVAMLQLALPKHPKIKLDLSEINLKKPAYTINTVRSLKLKLGREKIVWILGLDSFLTLKSWEGAQTLQTQLDFIIINRAINQLNNKNYRYKNNKKIVTLNLNCDISSTMIRDQLKININNNHYLPDPILKFIQNERLYCL